MKENEINKYLLEVKHPGKGDKSIVELGMVDSVEVGDNRVCVTLAFPKRKDPLTDYLIGATRAALYQNTPEGTEIEVKTVIRDESKPKPTGLALGVEELKNVSHIIGIASGKGGVGKSTVAVNLAVALARQGFRVGLADADVYGPSVPLMTGTEGRVPEVVEENGKQLMLPIEIFGVKWMSIGYFAAPGQALIWRGPMATNALKQMILQVRWGVLDYLLIDMPPGTGDIHITLVQDIPMEGAIIVTTPQNVALADVTKGVDMFRSEKINRRIFGLVENMSWFTPAELPQNRYFIFGKGGGEAMSRQFDIPLLGQIPLVQSICEDGDAGTPAALSSGPDGEAFLALAARVVSEINK